LKQKLTFGHVIAKHTKESSLFVDSTLCALIGKQYSGTAYLLYMLAHISLYFLLFLSLVGNRPKEGLIIGLDIFFIAHLLIHILFLKNHKNKFKNWFTWSLLTGASVFGLLDLFF